MNRSVDNVPCCNQSPIDLVDCIAADLPAIRFSYKDCATRIVNGEFAVELTFGADNRIEIEDRTFALCNLHFHVPAEHRLNGRDYVLEAHAVHASATGELAVIAVLYAAGPAHAAFDRFLALLPLRRGESSALEEAVRAVEFLPSNPVYYCYNGSRTTPPYIEGVRWMVMRETPTIAPAQAEILRRTHGGANNRPLQPLNARRVLLAYSETP